MMERDHVTEEVLLRIINIARQHLGGWAEGSAKDGLAAQFMYDNARAAA
jgi:hypothetical protein